MRKTIFIVLALLISIVLPQAASAENAEYVNLKSVDDLNSTAIIIRNNGDMYQIEYGVGVLSIWKYEGKSIIISSSGIFAGVGSKIILPDDDQDATIWNAEYLGNIYPSDCVVDNGEASTADCIIQYFPFPSEPADTQPKPSSPPSSTSISKPAPVINRNSNSVNIIFQDQPTTLKHPPIIIKGCILLPVRDTAELFSGGRDAVPFLWDAKTKAFTINYFVTSAKGSVGNKKVYSAYKGDFKHGTSFMLDVAPQIINGTTYAPIQFFTNGLGAEVSYDSKTKTLRMYIM